LYVLTIEVIKRGCNLISHIDVQRIKHTRRIHVDQFLRCVCMLSIYIKTEQSKENSDLYTKRS